ncbi:MAG: polysaccharide biosynthesis tyrosine autokinase, partial [Bacteroidales bacterium]|nr:polysaccharide biosynthesis tyrosine autokinase [Bacteroidales bacterium]
MTESTTKFKEGNGYTPEVAPEEESSFDIRILWYLLLRYKYWIIASIAVCMALAYVYLRYQTPVYSISSKILIKDQDQRRSYASSINNTFNELGFMNSSNGFDNEIEVLGTRTLNKKVVRALKLYTQYIADGRVRSVEVYNKYAPYLVDYEQDLLDSLQRPIRVEMEMKDKDLQMLINYGETSITKVISSFPSVIHAPFGDVFVDKNPVFAKRPDAYNIQRTLTAIIQPIDGMAASYAGRLRVSETSKMTTIAQVTITDNIPERGRDYLTMLARIYNEDANEDNNEEARRTADFIDERLGIISKELNTTEAELEQYKRQAGITNIAADAATDASQNIRYEQEIVEVSTQLNLIEFLIDHVNDARNHLQVIPSNVGLSDPGLVSMIAKYNEDVMERNRLLRTASENSPTVSVLTSQLEGYLSGIKASLQSARRQMAIRRSDLQGQQSKYASRISSAPGKERAMADIDRQKEVKAGLYLMLLQKREENSITLASSAYKGKMIEEPIASSAPISPKKQMIFLIAFIVGLVIPFIYYFVRQFFRYRVESKDDLMKLTKVPLLGSIPFVKALVKGDRTVVVQENRNSIMVEVYRTLRSNLPFVLEKDQNVILFTSSTSGEGKTSIASNLGASIAFVGKKVVVLGLDIRKPRLASLFDLSDTEKGISNFLSRDPKDVEYIDTLIQNSGISPNLDILPAGPIPPNPSELLERENLGVALDYLKKKYDYVLLDTAPIGLVSDTLTIAKYVDLTLYVIRANYTLKADLDLVNELAEDGRLPNVNLILNAEKEGEGG